MNVWNGAGKRIYMQEVGTRDGLQNEEMFVPTKGKVAIVNALSRAGMAKIEVTAFRVAQGDSGAARRRYCAPGN
jgi:hydroxymethylglutaryl-CoA lyase